MAVWKSGVHRREQAGDPFAMVRRHPPLCLLTASQLAEWESLCSWLLSWEPPPEPFMLTLWLTVVDPVKQHAYLAARIREGIGGQAQVGIFARLRLLYAKFGGD